MTGRGAWLLAMAGAAALYAAMVLWSLPRLVELAGGLHPFDLRPFGYDAEAARALVVALGPEGRAFYLGVQHGLDALYPPLLALVLAGAAVQLAPGWPGRALALVAGLGCAMDWAENATVAALLRLGPEGFEAALAARASAFTIAKGALTVGVMLALVALGLRALRRRRARRG